MDVNLSGAKHPGPGSSVIHLRTASARRSHGRDDWVSGSTRLLAQNRTCLLSSNERDCHRARSGGGRPN